MTAQELFAIVAAQYTNKPDSWVLSIGHHELPCPGEPVTIFNLPEFHAKTAITLEDVRRWALPELPGGSA